MLKKLAWKNNGIISLSVKDGLFTLAQMRICPYVQFFDIFNTVDEWNDINLNVVRELFCVTVATRTCIKPIAVQIIKNVNIKPNDRPMPRKMINPHLNFGKDGGYIFKGGNLIEIDERGETVGMPVLKRNLHAENDKEIIYSHELTNMWTTPEEVRERLLLYFDHGINWDSHKEKVFSGITPPAPATDFIPCCVVASRSVKPTAPEPAQTVRTQIPDPCSKASELDLIIKQLNVWSEEQGKDFLAGLISRFERFPRMALSELFRQYLSEPELADRLLAFARSNSKDIKFLINIVSALGNMIDRYSLPPSDAIFDFFLGLKDEKKIGYYVSMFIVKFPQFKNFPSRWDYIVSIPEIAPRSNSAHNFYAEIKRLLREHETIPSAYKEKIIEILGELSSKTKSDVMADEYRKTISVLLAS